jgi:hypothetical protein
MSLNILCNGIQKRETPNDVFYTPLPIAQKLIEMAEIRETDKVLDPSRGLGVFYDNLPPCSKDWCEITEDKDFFRYHKSVDVIIGNPPFSLWKKWFEHSIKLNPRKICYVIGCLNMTTRRLETLKEAGYKLTKLHIVSVNNWFGNTYLVVFDKEGEAIITHNVEIYKIPKTLTN